MNFLQKLTLYLLLYFTLSTSLIGQAVHIPDPNLRAAIRDTLSLSDDAPLTQDHMLKLKRIGYKLRGISNLAGLEYATNLESLALHVNEITDIRPLAGLTKLFHLNLRNKDWADYADFTD
ncbi:MAG: leucine-rich repeat domain-containing protein [Candidatus Poribacteria bacterium]|nr:leucine-rich repeat domain-containing protein [Candidatus Poribacteria bacterium]MDE0506010.1 leucine-rich repeat domain-containing protein [Candidatus Poribacteria bacterium]